MADSTIMAGFWEVTDRGSFLIGNVLLDHHMGVGASGAKGGDAGDPGIFPGLAVDRQPPDVSIPQAPAERRRECRQNQCWG